MPTPLVSVVLPFRDPGRYLGPAVESVLGQTLRDLELIAIDDGSTDGSAAALAPLAAADPRLRVVAQEGLGLVPTLNRGLSLARAALVARMDADDISLPERLERQVAFMERHPEVAAVGTAYRVFTDAGLTARASSPPTRPADVRAALASGNVMSHPSIVMRRDAVLGVGGYRAQFRDAEDYDLWLRLARRHDLANLPEVLLHYRRHANQSALARLEQQALSSMAAVACDQVRAAGRPDPAEQLTESVSWEFLRRLDLGDREISRRVALAYRETASQLLEEGLLDQAARLGETLAANVRSGRLAGRGAQGESRLAWFLIERARGRPLRALRHLLGWARATPGELGRRLAPRALGRRVARRLTAS